METGAGAGVSRLRSCNPSVTWKPNESWKKIFQRVHVFTDGLQAVGCMCTISLRSITIDIISYLFGSFFRQIFGAMAERVSSVSATTTVPRSLFIEERLVDIYKRLPMKGRNAERHGHPRLRMNAEFCVFCCGPIRLLN